MKCGGVVVSMKVTKGDECVLENSERIEVGDGLADPELVVRDPRHDFVADRRGRIVTAGYVKISRDDHWIGI